MKLWPNWYRPNLRRRFDVVERVCSEFGVTREELRGSGTKRELVTARWIAMTMLRERGLSYHSVGRLINRDHSSIMHGVNRLPDLLNRNPHLAGVVERLRMGF